MPFEVGTTLAAKYEIQRVLGQGGMGTVLLARHQLLDRLVAIKILRPDTSDDAQGTERLLREGRALARLRGRHIARVLDVEAPENGMCFLVLEYLEGEDLGAYLARTGRLSVSLAVRCVREACAALAEAHALGIVHRDVKPSNLFLTTLEDGSSGIKVIDFGIAKRSEPNQSITQSRSIIGSPCYMAPEQMRAGGSVDARSDIWSLGVVLFELLTGRLPYEGETVLEICASILESGPPSVRTHRAEISAELDLAIQRCLARDPAERFTTVNELADAIGPNPVLEREPSTRECSAESLRPVEPVTGRPRETQLETTLPAARGKGSRPWAWLVVVPVAVAGLWFTQQESPRPESPPQGSAATAVVTGSPSPLSAGMPTTVVEPLRSVPSADVLTPPVAPTLRQRARVAHRAAAIPSVGTTIAAPPLVSAPPKRHDPAADPVLQFGHY
jgi:serine/threonine-protein kinase